MNYNNNDARISSPRASIREKKKKIKNSRGKQKPLGIIGGWVAGIILAASSAQAQFVIQPNESTSKDAKTYGFLNTSNFQSNLGIIGVDSSPHQFRSLLQFDLSLVPFAASNVSLATLEIWVLAVDAVGDAALHEVTAPWSETAVTWDTFPAFAPTAVDTQSVSVSGQWISFDVTDSVVDWLNAPSTNNGWALIPSASANLTLADADGITGATPDPTKAPQLTIHSVPEPSSIFFIMAGAATYLARRRRNAVL